MPILVAFAAMGMFDGTERNKAYKALREWAKIHAQRDEVIRRAVAAGIDQRSIQEITGVARTTITRIVSASSPR